MGTPGEFVPTQDLLRAEAVPGSPMGAIPSQPLGHSRDTPAPGDETEVRGGGQRGPTVGDSSAGTGTFWGPFLWIWPDRAETQGHNMDAGSEPSSGLSAENTVMHSVLTRISQSPARAGHHISITDPAANKGRHTAPPATALPGWWGVGVRAGNGHQ